MLKKIICTLLTLSGISTIAFANDFENKLPLAGKTITSQELQKESIFTVYAFSQRVAPQNCTEFDIIDTEVSKEKVDNKWQEIWTVKTCSKTARIPIDFEIKSNYNIYAIDAMGVRVTESK